MPHHCYDANGSVHQRFVWILSNREGFNQVCNIFALLACDACPPWLEGSFRSHVELVLSLFHFIIPWKLAMPGFMSSNSPSRCSLTLKWMSGKVARNFMSWYQGETYSVWEIFVIRVHLQEVHLWSFLKRMAMSKSV